MPKSKKIRKKKAKKKIKLEKVAEPISHIGSNTLRPQKLKILNNPRLIYNLVFLSPLFIGAIVARGSIFLEIKLFILFFLMLVISCFWFKHFLDFKSLRAVLTYCFVLCLHMAIFALLGAYSQFPVVSLPISVLGLIPAFFLSAAIIVKNSATLQAAGLARSKLHVSKKGVNLTRPAAATKLFTTFLMLLPGLLIIAAIFNVLPIYFVLIGVVLIRTPVYAHAFQDETMSSERIHLGVLRLALLASFLMLLAGLLSRA